jgi:hypothetical protein
MEWSGAEELTATELFTGNPDFAGPETVVRRAIVGFLLNLYVAGKRNPVTGSPSPKTTGTTCYASFEGLGRMRLRGSERDSCFYSLAFVRDADGEVLRHKLAGALGRASGEAGRLGGWIGFRVRPKA